jgi:hypothetical protein
MAWTTPKTWSVGETLTAANFNLHIRDNLNFLKTQTARSIADQSVPNTTMTDATGMAFTIGASETWLVSIACAHHVGGNEDVKTTWTVPAGATGRQWYQASSALGSASAAIGSDLVAGTSGTADYIVDWSAVIVNSTNAGTCQWRFAQFGAGAEPSIFRANAVMIAQRMT